MENSKSSEKEAPLSDSLEVTKFANTRFVLILQHPQEPDKKLGTARLLERSLEHSMLKVGLSWRNLKAILGNDEIDPKKWGVLYLGSGAKNAPEGKPLIPVDKKGAALPPKEFNRALTELEGIIVIDGTWSQAKALWWRNAWLLKCQRLVLNPTRPSLYGKLRKEPRKECVSTIESTAEALACLGEEEQLTEGLRNSFAKLLEMARDQRKAARDQKPK